VRERVRGATTEHCEKRHLGLPRHLRHYIKKHPKNLLWGEGGWCAGGVDQLVIHEWMQQRVGRRECAGSDEERSRVLFIQPRSGPTELWPHKSKKRPWEMTTELPQSDYFGYGMPVPTAWPGERKSPGDG